jgi:hypothetical protein
MQVRDEAIAVLKRLFAPKAEAIPHFSVLVDRSDELVNLILAELFDSHALFANDLDVYPVD